MSVVRSSLFRHVFGKPAKSENSFVNVKPNVSAWDSNWVEVNAKYVAVPWQGGGGSVAILNQDSPGKINADTPTLSGHSHSVLELKFNPFNANIIATGSQDSTVKIWGIPEEGLTETINEPMVSLEGHLKKVGVLEFHPTANNILISGGADHKLNVWDIETGKSAFEVKNAFKDLQCISFNSDGSQFVTTSKDKKIRVMDPRNGENPVALEADGHPGTKGSRACWLTGTDKIFSCGFSKTSERQYMLWDPRKLDEPLSVGDIDMSAGILMPFYDRDTNIMFLAGKGDGNIRYYEMVNEEPYIHFLSSYQSTDPQKGMAMLPKVSVDTSQNEVARLYKLTSDQITPISFTVPRKSDLFQEDIYPKTSSPKPAMQANEYIEGKNAERELVSMNPADGELDVETVKLSDFKPTAPKKKPPTQLPKKANSPKELMKQNDELRKRVDQLEKEKWDLEQKVKGLEGN